LLQHRFAGGANQEALARLALELELERIPRRGGRESRLVGAGADAPAELHLQRAPLSGLERHGGIDQDPLEAVVGPKAGGGKLRRDLGLAVQQAHLAEVEQRALCEGEAEAEDGGLPVHIGFLEHFHRHPLDVRAAAAPRPTACGEVPHLRALTAELGRARGLHLLLAEALVRELLVRNLVPVVAVVRGAAVVAALAEGQLRHTLSGEREPGHHVRGAVASASLALAEKMQADG